MGQYWVQFFFLCISSHLAPLYSDISLVMPAPEYITQLFSLPFPTRLEREIIRQQPAHSSQLTFEEKLGQTIYSKGSLPVEQLA